MSKRKVVIHVDGVQGSGKTYLCSQLQNVVCVDTDDTVQQAVAIIERSQRTRHKIPRTYHQMKKVQQQLIQAYIDQHDKIVFVGMTAEIPSATHQFFIKITDFPAVYKRLLLRELDKIVTNAAKIKSHLEKERNPREIDVARIANLALMFPVSYASFLKDYQERLAEAKKKKYVPKTQAELIRLINQLQP